MVESLGLQPDEQFASPAPCLSWSGQQFGMQIHILQNGVCTPSHLCEPKVWFSAGLALSDDTCPVSWSSLLLHFSPLTS